MKPTLSLSAVFSTPAAPEMIATAASEAAAPAAAAVTTEDRMFDSAHYRRGCGFSSRGARPPATGERSTVGHEDEPQGCGRGRSGEATATRNGDQHYHR